MATSAGPAGLTAAAAEEREGAAAAGSGPAAPPSGPAAFLSLPAPFSEEGTRRGAGGAAAATGPRPEPRGKRGLGGGGGRGGPCGSRRGGTVPCGARRRVRGGLGCAGSVGGGVSVPLQGLAGGGSSRSAPEPPSWQEPKYASAALAPGPFSPGAGVHRDEQNKSFRYKHCSLIGAVFS